MSNQRPDRAAGLVARIDDKGDNEQLVRSLGMIRGVLRVIDMKKSCSVLVVFERAERTGSDEMGSAIRTTVEAVIGRRIMIGREGPEVRWLEDHPFGPASDVRREAWEALREVADRVFKTTDDLATANVGGHCATTIRHRVLVAREINEAAGKILCQNKGE